MKFKIGDCESQDEIIIEAETLEEIKEIAQYEVSRRGWQEPYSMKIGEQNK